MEKKDKGKKTPVIDPNMSKEDKARALDDCITQINKTFGAGAITTVDGKTTQKVDVISTGCLSIDLALGIGGLPRGRIVEIYGPESSGKTTLSLHVIAEAQKAGGYVAFIDAEHALDPVYASRLGINLSELYISQPDSGEQALDITEALVRSGALDVIVVDSVAALTPKVEIDGEMGESHVGLQARLMSQALRKLAGVCNKTKTCIIFINQLREKVGVVYGSPEVTPGGKALKFYSSVRIDVRKGEPVKNGTEIIGNRTKIKIVKNKLASPFKIAEVDIIYGKGISKESSLLELALRFDIIQKSGSWFSYNDERLAQGKEAVKALLEQNKDLYNEIESKVKAKVEETGLTGESDTSNDEDNIVDSEE